MSALSAPPKDATAQSDWSQLSPSALTHPESALAPYGVTVLQPTSSTLLVAWQFAAIRDCQLDHARVEARQGPAEWFEPQGCGGLASASSFYCTASALSPGTTYSFRVSIVCANPLANSLPSAASEPTSTSTATGTIGILGAARRMLSSDVTMDIPFERVLADGALQSALKETAKAVYGRQLGASGVSVGLRQHEARAGGRRLDGAPASRTLLEVRVTGDDDFILTAQARGGVSDNNSLVILLLLLLLLLLLVVSLLLVLLLLSILIFRSNIVIILVIVIA